MNHNLFNSHCSHPHATRPMHVTSLLPARCACLDTIRFPRDAMHSTATPCTSHARDAFAWTRCDALASHTLPQTCTRCLCLDMMRFARDVMHLTATPCTCPADLALAGTRCACHPRHALAFPCHARNPHVKPETSHFCIRCCSQSALPAARQQKLQTHL
jgi:hypothetical protein